MNRDLDKLVGMIVYGNGYQGGKGFYYLEEDQYGDVTVLYEARKFPLPFYSTNMGDCEKLIAGFYKLMPNYGITIEYAKDGKRIAKISGHSGESYMSKHRCAATAICLCVAKMFATREEFNSVDAA